ncbi:hypothetical protein TcWFU_004152 [Taenia crassiceps]|uniref:Uncharacterized protein n=1 Tax=Taenia crassiceps TaxID=6207 RepID=A0ABR4QB13_9CEST
MNDDDLDVNANVLKHADFILSERKTFAVASVLVYNCIHLNGRDLSTFDILVTREIDNGMEECVGITVCGSRVALLITPSTNGGLATTWHRRVGLETLRSQTGRRGVGSTTEGSDQIQPASTDCMWDVSRVGKISTAQNHLLVNIDSVSTIFSACSLCERKRKREREWERERMVMRQRRMHMPPSQ